MRKAVFAVFVSFLFIGCGGKASQGGAALNADAALNVDMAFVEGGTFAGGGGEVTVGSFNIGRYEVTQRLWKSVTGDNPSHFKGNDDLPVETAGFDDVQGFIRKLNEKTGKNYRLPSDDEWEYAARGGNKSRGYKYSGGDNIGDVAWYVENSDGKTHPVGTKQANELGIYDMSGNVMEWTSVEAGGRGGGWFNGDGGCEVTERGYIQDYSESDRSSMLGLRLALDP